MNNIIKPSCVIDYNKGMGGIDKHEQLLSCFPIMRKCVKGCKEMFFYLVDMAIYNVYVLHSKITNTTKTCIVSFHLNIAEELLEKITLSNYKKCGRPVSSDTPQRLQVNYWAHFPEYIPPTKSKEHLQKMCHVCFQYQIRKDITRHQVSHASKLAICYLL